MMPVKKMIRIIAVAVSLMASFSAMANDGHAVKLDQANTSVLDTLSLQRGAQTYAQYCMGCHSLKYLRVNRLARDVKWTPEEAITRMQYLREGKGKPQEAILTTADAHLIKQAFGVLPPDLSLEARLRGKNWVYTFLRSYERGEDMKVTNHLFAGVSMPFILEGLQNSLSPAEFDAVVTDLVNFLDYAAEPAKPVRLMLGWWVLGFLFVLFVLTVMLKQEFWRDVKHQE